MSYSFQEIDAWVKKYGCPLYIYDTQKVIQQICKLSEAYTGYTLLYSLKCNNHPEVLRCIKKQGLGVDAASGNEVIQAVEQGCTKDAILYSAPAKSDADILKALPHSIIIADSYTELERINTLCAQKQITAQVGLRISPTVAFTAGHNASISKAKPDKFGVSEEDLLVHKELLHSFSHCKLVGFHVFVRSQNLHADSLKQLFTHIESLADIWTQDLELELSFINFGGGFGISYAKHMQELELSSLQEQSTQIREKLVALYPNIQLYIESGRFLVGEAGTFVTQIVDIKHSRGKTFALAPGFLSVFLRPAIGGFAELMQTEKLEGPYEPLWSGSHTIKPRAVGKSVPALKVHLAGNLCTALDTIARDIELENIALGNYLLFPNAGAYGAVLSPYFFSSHEPPTVLVL